MNKKLIPWAVGLFLALVFLPIDDVVWSFFRLGGKSRQTVKEWVAESYELKLIFEDPSGKSLSATKYIYLKKGQYSSWIDQDPNFLGKKVYPENCSQVPKNLQVYTETQIYEITDISVIPIISQKQWKKIGKPVTGFYKPCGAPYPPKHVKILETNTEGKVTKKAVTKYKYTLRK